MSRIATVLVTGLIVLTLGEATDARSFRPAMLPNAPDGCNTCHTSGGGTPRNAFGLDVEAIVGSSEQQFWSAELAALDSDGDGVSNGWELGDPDGDGDPDPTISITSPGDAAASTPEDVAVTGGSIVSGTVYYSTTPVEGVKVELRDENDDVLMETTSSSSGAYEFSGIQPGEYLVGFDGSAVGWGSTSWGNHIVVELQAITVNFVLPAKPGSGSELDFLYGLLSEFDGDPDLVLFVFDNDRFDEWEQGLLSQFADEYGELGRADLERAIASFEEKEFDEGESWEDILAEQDSNDNGVIDEEDYRAAQDGGDEFDEDESWEDILADLDSNGDGVIDEEEYNSRVEQDEDWFAGDGPAPGSELDFLYGLLSEFDADPDLVLFAGDARFHLIEQGLLFEFADEFGELGRADLERAISFFEGGAPGPELDLLYGLLPLFDADPDLVLSVFDDDHFDDWERDILSQFADPVGELRREDLEAGIAASEGGSFAHVSTELRRGIVSAIDVESGEVQVEASGLLLLEETEFFDGESGAPLDPHELQEGDQLAVQVLYTVEGQPIATRVVRNGDHPEGIPTLWIEFGGFTELDDGTTQLVEKGIVWSLATETIVVAGEERFDIPLEEVSPGDEVVLAIQHGGFGSVVFEIHVDPSGPSQPGEEHFWGMTQRLFDVDVDLGVVRFAKAPFGITVNTRYLDKRGNPIDPGLFEFGEAMVAKVDFRTGDLLVLQREDPGVPFPHPDDPDIGVVYAAFGTIEERAALLFDSYGFSLAVDAPILDEQSGELLDPEQLGDFTDEFIYVLVMHPQPGDSFGDLIVEVIVNPEDRPLGPGERPTPTEVFGEWKDTGVVGEVLPETQEIVMAGIQIQTGGDTEVVNQNGFTITVDELRPGDFILVEGLPLTDYSIEASYIEVDPEFPPQGFDLPLFTEVVLRVENGLIQTDGGRWWIDENAVFADGQKDEILELSDFAPGDEVSYDIIHTNVGDFVQQLVRNPVVEEPLDEIWFQDGEVFDFEPETRRLRFVGPQFAIRSGTEAFDWLGRRVNLGEIPTGTEVVIREAPSFTGGPPIAISVDVFNPETIYDGPDLVFVTFAGVAGDLITTTDFPRYVALDAQVSFGNGDPGDLAGLVLGTRVRATINHPPPGIYSPFGDVVGSITIDPAGAGDLTLGSVNGSVGLTGDEITEASVLLTDPTADFVRVVVDALVGSDGAYSIPNVAPGEYGLLLEAKTVAGRNLLEGYDADADGVADNVRVADGALEGIDFALTVGELPEIGANAVAAVSLDLDAAAGDQGVRNLEVGAGEIVRVEVRASGLVDVAGYGVSIGFDPSQLEFSRLLPGAEENNLLAAVPEALVRFSPPVITASGLTFAATTVGASDANAGAGDGLLGVVEFLTLEDFGSATVALREVTLTDIAGGRNAIASEATALLAEPLNLWDQPKGILSFDFNEAMGDDERFHQGNVQPGEEISVQVFVNDVSNQINYSIKVLYDPDQLTYISFVEGDFLGTNGGNAFSMPPLLTDTTVEFGMAILGAQESQAVSGSGLMGSLTFSTTEAFTETDIVITEYSIGEFAQGQVMEEASIFARISQQSLGHAVAKADFDGDGVVGFFDFFLFAAVFGTRVGVDTEIYDLDGDGFIGFGDLFRFSDSFGEVVAKLAAGVEAATVPGALQLEAEANGDRLDVILGTADLPARGFGVVVTYDESAFRLEQVADASSVLRQDGQEPLLLSREEPGAVIIAGARTGLAVGGGPLVDGRLATLRFAPLSPQASSEFAIHEAVVQRSDGTFAAPEQLGRVTGRWAPASFALHSNFPNPFNPSTTIRYQLAETALVRLQVYDVLGQRVRELVGERQAAGYYQVQWDSRDDYGRPVAAGVYLYRLEAGDFAQVRKLLLLK